MKIYLNVNRGTTTRTASPSVSRAFRLNLPPLMKLPHSVRRDLLITPPSSSSSGKRMLWKAGSQTRRIKYDLMIMAEISLQCRHFSQSRSVWGFFCCLFVFVLLLFIFQIFLFSFDLSPNMAKGHQKMFVMNRRSPSPHSAPELFKVAVLTKYLCQ